MRNRIIVVGVIAFLAFAIGSRVTRPEIKNRESVRHQLVRIWNDPKERKRRRRAAEKAAKKVRKAIEDARN